jgi:dTDP-4-dehydrorhamnose reductase
MKILITGANGMVARAAINHCRSIGDEVVALTRQGLDISDRAAVFETFERENFDAVLNCAAYTNVDGAETNKEICYKANAFGVENIALASKQTGSVFVTISTDYVFDGAKRDFYTQEDAPNPQSVYAKSKFEGEILAKRAFENSIIVRSGWIYGMSGTNFLSVMHKFLADGKTIRAIKDSYGTPTFAADLAKRLRELAALSEPGVFHVVNSGDGASYLEFAEKVCEIGGFEKKLVEPVSFADLKRPAPRPQSSKLACLLSRKLGLKPLQNWEEALAEFLK